VIAASNKDLDLLVSRKLFREDLLYRINALQIRIPALRERKDDIAGFVHFFLSMFNAKYSKNIAAVDPGAFALLNGYDWPGNVRELKNCIERAAIVCEGDAISISDLPESLVRWERSDDDVLPPSANYRSEYMRKLIVATLERTEGNKSDAARVLKVSRRTLYNWLRDFRIGHE
jgi:DNA-binding NtrC family response regulator